MIRDDVPPGALAVVGGPQRNIEGWVAREAPRQLPPPRPRGGRKPAAARETSTDADDRRRLLAIW